MARTKQTARRSTGGGKRQNLPTKAARKLQPGTIRRNQMGGTRGPAIGPQSQQVLLTQEQVN